MRTPAADAAEQALELLRSKVRAMTLEQILLPSVATVSVRQALRRLEQRNLIERRVVMMEPILELKGPAIAWAPTDPPPPFGVVSWQLRSRWRSRPQRTLVFTATRLAMGMSRRLRASEIRHDCHVAEVYRKLKQYRPAWAEHWVHEDQFAEQMFTEGRVPDAAIASDPIVAIEFGGSYRADKLLSFHVAMAAQNIPYEVW